MSQAAARLNASGRASRTGVERVTSTYAPFKKPVLRKVGYYNPDSDANVDVYAESDNISTAEVHNAYKQIHPVLEAAVPDPRDQDKISYQWGRFREILAESMINRQSASQTIRNRQRPDEPEEYEPVPIQQSDPEKREMRIRTFFDGIEGNSFTTYMKQFEKVFEHLISRAKSHGFCDRPVNVHLDGTDFVYTPQAYDENNQKKSPTVQSARKVASTPTSS